MRSQLEIQGSRPSQNQLRRSSLTPIDSSSLGDIAYRPTLWGVDVDMNEQSETCVSCLGALGHWHIVGTRGYFEECKASGGTGKRQTLVETKGNEKRE